jgi:hypothetical protein
VNELWDKKVTFQMDANGQSTLLTGYGLDVGGKRPLADISSEEVSTKRLKIGTDPDAYVMPLSEGKSGEVIVADGLGGTNWEHPVSAGNAVLENILFDALNDVGGPALTIVKSTVSTNAWQLLIDPQGNRIVTGTDGAGPGWNPPVATGVTFVYFETTLPNITNTNDSRFLLRVWGNIGGRISGDEQPDTQKNDVYSWIQEQTEVAPVGDELDIQLKVKNVYHLRKLSPRAGLTWDYDSLGESSQMYEVNIDPVLWHGKTVRVGFAFINEGLDPPAPPNIVPNGASFSRMQLLLQFHGNGAIATLPGDIDHQTLANVGTLTHSTIDSYLDQGVKTSDSPTFGSVRTGLIVGPVVNGNETVYIFDDLRVGNPGTATGGLIIQTNNTGAPDFAMNIGGTPALRICAQGSDDGFFATGGNQSQRIEWDSSGFIFTNELRLDQGLSIGFANPTTNYTLPAVRGLANQILKTDAGGIVTWEDSPFDQSLDKSDSVSFYRVDAPVHSVSLNNEDAIALSATTPAGVGSEKMTILHSATGFPNTNIMSFTKDSIETLVPLETKAVECEGPLTIGVPAVNYIMPTARGFPGQVLKLGEDGQTVGWDTVGKYSQYQTVDCNGWAGPPAPGPTSMTLSGAAASKGSLYLPPDVLKEGDCIHIRVSGTIFSEGKNEEVELRVVANGTDVAGFPVTRDLHSTTFIDLAEVKNNNPFEWEVDLQVRSTGIAGLDNGLIYSNSQFSYTKAATEEGGKMWNSNGATTDIGLAGPTNDWTLDVLAEWQFGSAANLLSVQMMTFTKTF